MRGIPNSPLVERLGLATRSGPTPTERTTQFLRVNNIESLANDGQWSKVIPRVQQITDRNPTPENTYALAELAFIAGKQSEHSEPKEALDHFGLSVSYAYNYLFNEDFQHSRTPYDPQFRGACDIYNGAVEAGLRLYCSLGGNLLPGHTYRINSDAGSWLIRSELREGPWRNEEIEELLFASDYDITGLKNQYRRYGLGVPLVAVRSTFEDEPTEARYYPPNLSFPLTAFVRPTIDLRDGQREIVIELYDTLHVQTTQVANRAIPLETDLTTPLAYFLSNPQFGQIATAGLLAPDRLLDVRSWLPEEEQTPISGLYMVQPFEPDKIPVVMVHGLWSSPMTWMEMFNDLRSQPKIRDNYQFWFYLYPSAQPFWVSAAQMRDDLAELRKTVDPQGFYPEMNQMVLVGHSMGGLVSTLQTIDSKDDIWRLVSDKPFDEARGDPELQKELEKWMFFRPNPSIRRVVTIGTPHRGSDMSNDTTQWISGNLISLPKTVTDYLAGFSQENSDLIKDDRLLRIDNSIDSLSPESPFFPVMLASHHPEWVRYHNIIGVLPKGTIRARLSKSGDGVVPVDSARIEGVVSEIEVPADHISVHAHPRSVLEVRRILLEHLSDIRTGKMQPPGTVRYAQPPRRQPVRR